MTKQVAVIGAGITGVTTAYYLAKEGYKVTVFEQEPYPAMRTSYANGGQLSVSNSETWTTWSNVKKGIKWMFKKDAPLLFKPRFEWAQWKWMAKFIYTTATNRHRENTLKTVEMGMESMRLYRELIESEYIRFDHSPCGILHFYKDGEYWENARDISRMYREVGLNREELMRAVKPEDIDPALADIRGVVGLTYTPSDATGDIHKFCYELAEILKYKHDVKFNYGYPVDLASINIWADAVVVCAGIGSVALAKEVGDTLDIYPVKGYSITINNVDPKYLPKVSLLDDQAKIVTATLGNKFRVAGTAELAGENYDIRRDRIEPLLKWVHANFPKINTHDYSSWACLRPMTPDMMPIVKQSDKNSKVFYNTGHGHLGWTLGPATAKLITEKISASLKK